METTTIRTEEQINVAIAELKNERLLALTIPYCNGDKEVSAVKKHGTTFVSKYSDQLQQMGGCWCENHEMNKDDLMVLVCADIGITITERGERRVRELFHATGMPDLYLSQYPHCLSTFQLIRAYCVAKNNPLILKEVKK